MNYLKFEQFQKAFQILKSAERDVLVLLQRFGASNNTICHLLTVTLNNLACYHKKKGLERAALRYLCQILAIEKFHLKDGSASIASTYLNISTILSSLGKHIESIQFSKRAQFLYSSCLPEKGKKLTKENSPTLHALIISFINIATGYYKLGKHQYCVQTASAGLEKSSLSLGADHPLSQRLEDLLSKSRSKLNPRLRLRIRGLSGSIDPPRPDKAVSIFNPYMRAQSAHCTKMQIGCPEGGLQLRVDPVRGDVSVDPPTSKKTISKHRIRTLKSQNKYRNGRPVSCENSRKVYSQESSQPFAPMPQEYFRKIKRLPQKPKNASRQAPIPKPIKPMKNAPFRQQSLESQEKEVPAERSSLLFDDSQEDKSPRALVPIDEVSNH